MASFDVLLPKIMPEISGVPEPIVISKITTVAKKFFGETLVWSEYLAVSTVEGESDISLTPTIGAPVKVISVSKDERELKKQALFPPSQTIGAPAVFTAPARGYVRLYPTPDAVYSITVHVAVQPTTDIPDDLMDAYGDAIAVGTKAELLLMNAGWANPQLGLGYLAEFKQLMADVRIEVFHAFTVGSQTVQMQRFI